MSDSEYEEILVYADFKNQLLPDELGDPNTSIKIIGIDTDNPIAEINGSVFKGSYDYAMGTNVFFEKDEPEKIVDPVFQKTCKQRYKYFTKTTKVINFQRLFVERRSPNAGAPMDVDAESAEPTTSQAAAASAAAMKNERAVVEEDDDERVSKLKTNITYEEAIKMLSDAAEVPWREYTDEAGKKKKEEEKQNGGETAASAKGVAPSSEKECTVDDINEIIEIELEELLPSTSPVDDAAASVEQEEAAEKQAVVAEKQAVVAEKQAVVVEKQAVVAEKQLVTTEMKAVTAEIQAVTEQNDSMSRALEDECSDDDSNELIQMALEELMLTDSEAAKQINLFVSGKACVSDDSEEVVQMALEELLPSTSAAAAAVEQRRKEKADTAALEGD